MTVLPLKEEKAYNDNIVVHTTIFDEVKDLIGGHTPSLEAYSNEHSNDRCSLSMQGDQFLMSETRLLSWTWDIGHLNVRYSTPPNLE